MCLFRRRPLATFALLATLVTALTACKGGDQEDARLRLLNASADLGTLDLMSDKDKLSGNVGALALGDYGGRDAGVATLHVRTASSATTVVSTPATLKSDARYTLIAYGGADAVRTSLLQEDQDEPAADQSKLMVLNLAPDAGALTVFMTAADAPLANAVPFATNLAVGGGSGYVTHAAGSYRIRVTDANNRADLRLDLPALKLESGKVATLILRGSAGGTLVHGLLLRQRGDLTRLDNASARVRLVTSLASGNVDATMGDQQLLKGGTSPAIGDYQVVPAGARELRGTINAIAISKSVNALVAGGDYTMLVRGDAAAPTIDLLTDDNRLPANASQTRVRLLNGLGQPLSLDANYSQLAGSVAPASYGAGTITPSGTTRLSVSSPRSSTPLYVENSLSTQANSLYTVLMLGDDTQPKPVLRKDR